MEKIDGKVVWITGASSGIGEQLAYDLSEKNCKLILSARNISQLKRVKDTCLNSDQVAIVPLDLANYDEAPLKVSEAIHLYGKIDVLINNAGISQRSLIKDTDFKVYQELIEIDYLGTVALSKALLDQFIVQKNGHFIVVSSLMGKFASPYRSGYCGAKHALHGFFDALRMEHEKDGITVTMVCPGFVQTNIAKNALTADGTVQGQNDKATEKGLTTTDFCKKMIRAIEHKKFEVYIGGKEVMGIYVKRFFPKLLHKLVLRSQVR